LGHGVGYKYAHDFPGHFVAQDYLGVDKVFYEPTDQGLEKKIRERLQFWRAQLARARAAAGSAGSAGSTTSEKG
jgi:putative ATPase